MVAPVVATGARTLASEAYNFAARVAPSVVEKAKAYAFKGNGDLAKLVTKNDANSQQMALSALIKGGMDVRSFSESTELTDAERKKLAALNDKVAEKFRNETNVTAAPVAEADVDTFRMELAMISRSTGLSATELFRMKMVMNRLTTDEVERYEARGGNRTYGQMADALAVARRA